MSILVEREAEIPQYQSLNVITLFFFRSANDTWIGLIYQQEIGSWLWDGVASNAIYFNWGDNEPNQYAFNQETGVRMHSETNHWWDMFCAKRFYYICEKGTGKFHVVIFLHQNELTDLKQTNVYTV